MQVAEGNFHGVFAYIKLKFWSHIYNMSVIENMLQGAEYIRTKIFAHSPTDWFWPNVFPIF